MRKSAFTHGAVLLLTPVLIMTGLTACNNRQNQAMPDQSQSGHIMSQDSHLNQMNHSSGNDKPIDQPYVHNYNGTYDGTKPNVYTERDAISAQQVAARVTEIARSVPGVNRAAAVAQGIDIVVGIDGTGDTRALEQQVMSAAKQKESGYNIFVTSNADLHNRIRTLYTNMNNVRGSQVAPGISGIIYEIGRLNGR